MLVTEIFICTPLAEKISTLAKGAAEDFAHKYGRKPCLAVVLAGDDPASAIYVGKKGEACARSSIDHKDFRLSASEGFAKLVALIEQLNKDPQVDGILVQSPLPKGWDESQINALVSPAKDVDGFHPLNAGHLLLDTKKALAQGLVPCTPAGVMEILKEKNISLAGKKAVVVGRSNIVGKPMVLMLLSADATVSICHSKTTDLATHTSQADILVSAIGKFHWIGAKHVKPGAVVIDVGICRTPEGKVGGDVDASALQGIASLVTPVPRGVGPMTIALLIRNTVRAAWLREEQRSQL